MECHVLDILENSSVGYGVPMHYFFVRKQKDGSPLDWQSHFPLLHQRNPLIAQSHCITVAARTVFLIVYSTQLTLQAQEAALKDLYRKLKHKIRELLRQLLGR